MKYKLFKIVVDNYGNTGDGSDAQEHCELMFTGNEKDLRQKMLEYKIVETKFQSEHIPVECLSYFTSRKGFILSAIKED